MFDQLRVHVVWGWLGRLLALLVVVGLVAGSAYAWDGVAYAQEPVTPSTVLAPGVVIHYQAQLLDPATGQPKADGVYPMVFRLYNVNTGGSALWTESKNVTVSRGAFSTLLGDTTGLNLDHFSGQDLWLGVTVGADAEAMPRQRIAYAPYALRAVNAGNADTVDGQHAAAFAASSHSHAGEQITSGTVADARIAASIARDGEVTSIVAGSGQFSAAGHNHLGQTWTGSNNPLSFQGSYSSAPLVLRNTGGDGLQIPAAGDDGIQINSVNYGVYVVSPTTYGLLVYGSGDDAVRIDTPTGDGVSVLNAGGNGVRAETNGSADTIYARNAGGGKGLSAYSYSGVPGWFGTYGNLNLLVAEEEVTPGSWDVRFRVERLGNVRADGQFYGGGADFAEMLPGVQGLNPGDVLVIGPDGQLQLSMTPNAANVAGVFSTQPGFVGGDTTGADASLSPSAQQPQEETIMAAPLASADAGKAGSPAERSGIAGSAAINASAGGDPNAKQQTDGTAVRAAVYAATGKLPLAVLGVVPTNVTAEGGPIVPGDLLTTSSTPGHAMKAAPVDVGGVQLYRPGTILGKALEPLAAGTGVIKVLVMPQ